MVSGTSPRSSAQQPPIIGMDTSVQTKPDGLPIQFSDDAQNDVTAEDQRPPMEAPVKRDPTRVYVNNLRPPGGLKFWRFHEFHVMTDKAIYWHKYAGGIGLGTTITWKVDAYVYTVNADPTEETFQDNQGAIYIVLVHSGVAKTGSVSSPTQEFRYTVRILNPQSGQTSVKQLPETNSGVTTDNTTKYPISFAQDMQMIGQGAFVTFNAQYEDEVRFTKGRQMGGLEGLSGIQWGVRLDTPTPYYEPFGFGSLSVFRLLSPALVNLECVASVYDHGYQEDVAIHFEHIQVDGRFKLEA